MNKTVILATSIIASVFAIVSYWYIGTIKDKIASKERIEIKLGTRVESIPMDRFTVCMQTVMSEARQSGKPISASEAKDICAPVEKV